MKNFRKIGSYGTPSSEHQPLLETPRPAQKRRKRASFSSQLHRKGYAAIIGICLILIWSFTWRKNHDTSAAQPTPTPTNASLHHHTRQASLYLWLAEYGRPAQDPTLASLKSLYAVDKLMTNTSNCYQSVTDVFTLSLDRASYTDMSLGNIFLNPGKFDGILQADLISCGRSGSDSSPSSQSGNCQVVANDYLRRMLRDGQRWPPRQTFQVAKHFNLAFRPVLLGSLKARPYICSRGSVGPADFAAKASKSGRQLTVGCFNRSPLKSPGTFSAASKIGPTGSQVFHDTVPSVLMPGFYTIPSQVPESYNLPALNRRELGDEMQEKLLPSPSITTPVATVASGRFEHQIWRLLCTWWGCRWSGRSGAQPRLDQRGLQRRDESRSKPTEKEVRRVGAAGGAGIVAAIALYFLTYFALRHRYQRKARQQPQAVELGQRNDRNPPQESDHPSGGRVPNMPPEALDPRYQVVMGSADSTHSHAIMSSSESSANNPEASSRT
ncbi:MAG: hypothetical protein Q9201_001587 [Fulgogasparrea decipioides]